ncbi:MAG TPA: ComEC/Rec2 family competence protein [Candidatus Dormibacteraeota bacterium]
MSPAVGEGALPAVLVAGALATGVSLAAVGALPAVVPPATALAGGGAGVTAALTTRRPRAWALAAVALLAAAAGMVRGTEAPAATRLPIAAGAVVLVGTVRDAPVGHRAEALVTVDAERLAGAGGEGRVGGGVLAALPGHPDLAAGDRVRLEAAALRLPGERSGPTSAAALQRDGVAAVAVSPRLVRLAHGRPGPARALAALRGRIAATVGAALPPVTATLLLEIAFGIHGTLPPDTAAALRDAGLVHLVATSGLKVAIVIGLLTRLAAGLSLGPRRRLLLIGPAVALYVAIAGGGAAALRSALMAGAALLVHGTGRRLQPLALLAATAALLLAADPGLCADPGFQLSFLGTLGILLLAGPLTARLPGPRWLAEPFAVTVAAQAATVPVMASTFGVLALAAPLANALVIPAVPLLVVLGWAGAAVATAVPALGWAPLAAAGLLISGIGLVARAVAAMPGSALHLGAWPRAWTWALLAGLGAGGLGLVAALRLRLPATITSPSRTQARLAAAAAAVVVAAATLLLLSGPDGRLHLVVLDTGGSEATLVRAGDGATALVDGGSDPTRLLGALGHALPPLTRSLDLVVLSGGDRTTVAGLAGLPGGYRAGAVVVPAAPLGRGAEQAVDGLRAGGATVVRMPAGRPWSWHGTVWRLLVPTPPDRGPVTGAVQVAGGGGVALVLGALPPPGQDELAAVAGGSLAAELLVAPARGAVAPALLAAAHPRLLAVPSARAPRLPSAPGAGVRSTAIDGSLEYVGGPGGLEPS